MLSIFYHFGEKIYIDSSEKPRKIVGLSVYQTPKIIICKESTMTGKEFRRWRRSLEISQQVVADHAECNKSTICRWEKEQITKQKSEMYV